MTEINKEAQIKGTSPFAADKQIASSFNRLSERVSEIENGEQSYIRFSVADVSTPPTDAELDTAFGTPASLGRGFIAFVDDAAAETNVYLVGTTATAWWHVALTKAV